MTDIIKSFQDANIRFVTDSTGKYEWGIIAADLANILGYSGTDKLNRLVDNEYKISTPTPLNGGGGEVRDMTVLWEPGIYQALARSNKPKAKPFQKWLYEEVLPSIRKQGGYIDPSANNSQLTQLMDMVKDIQDKNKKILDQNADLIEFKDNITKTYPGVFSACKAVDLEPLTVVEFIQAFGLDISLRHKLSKTAAHVQRFMTDIPKLPKRNNQNVYDVKILKEAYRQLTGIVIDSLFNNPYAMN